MCNRFYRVDLARRYRFKLLCRPSVGWDVWFSWRVVNVGFQVVGVGAPNFGLEGVGGVKGRLRWAIAVLVGSVDVRVLFFLA